tara:strand:- start:2832 stop:3383 length:552 start_codon:yes stop_codon:yes gene_type:complete
MKQKIRENYLKIRKKKYFELSENNKIFLAKNIKKLCTKNKVNKLALYCPINYELNILSAISKFNIKKMQTCLPVVEKQNNMSFKEWKIQEPFKINRIGILEPNYENKRIYPQMILVPLVAYDKFKNRIGYGKGFYDRFFNKFSKKKNILSVGIAFSFQQIEKIPEEKYDKKLDYILTEKGIFH